MGTYIIRDVQDFLIERWGQKQMRSDVDLQLAAHAKQVRLENAQLREQNRVLEREYTRLFNLAKPIATLLQDLKIIPIGCSREQELAWKMAVKNFRHYQQGYEASVAIEAALTATSQEGQHESR